MGVTIDAWVEAGSDARRGNLLGIQPWVHIADYRSAGSLYAALDGYFAAAAGRAWLQARTVAVLPEYLGSWLVAVNEPPALFRAKRMSPAMSRLALRHGGAFLAGMLGAPAADRVKYALFRARAGAMAHAYTEVFGALARHWRVTIVAGSILLPAPYVRAGRVLAGRGALENVAAVFHPNGLADERLARKQFLTAAEQPFIAPATRPAPAIYDTPAGRLGVLVCADAFYPASYAALAGQGVELLAVPSYLETSNIWHQPWLGYNGGPAPADVRAADLGAISERQAWLRYGMAGRIAAAGIPYGVNVFLRGEILDLGSDGATLLARHGEVRETAATARTALASVWLA